MPDLVTQPHATVSRESRLTAPLGTSVILWVIVVFGGMLSLAQYSSTPGASPPPPPTWPVQSKLSLDPDRPTLVMFLHPRCPCSAATVGELERLMAGSQGQLSTQVLFIQPAGLSEDWSRTDLWRQAAAIPGVTVRSDHAGREAGLFHAETSGQTLVYESKGTLVFHGGITIARGHRGDNPGSDAILALLGRKLSSPAQTPAFGCSLCGTERALPQIP